MPKEPSEKAKRTMARSKDAIFVSEEAVAFEKKTIERFDDPEAGRRSPVQDQVKPEVPSTDDDH